MKRPPRRHVFKASLLGLLIAGPTPWAFADFGAVTSGSWSSSGTWTPVGVPGASDNVYIGGNYPSGAAQNVTVFLTQNQSAATVVLGYNNNANATLNLGTSTLTANSVSIGLSAGATGTITRSAGGALALSGGLSVNNGNAATLGAADTMSILSVDGVPSSKVTTAAAGNVKDYATAAGGTINLGADLNLTGYAQVYGGGTIDAHGHNLTAGALYLGNGAGSTGSLANQGTITVSNVQLNNGTLAMGAADTVGSLYAIAGSTATTSATGNITGGTTLNGASTLNLGADLNLGNNALAVGQGTVNAGGHAITAGNVTLGDGTNAGVLNNTGPLTVSGGLSLNSNQGAFAFKAADTTSGLYVSPNATATTVATGNVKDYAIASGGTINLGADLNLTGYAQAYNGGTIDAHSHNLTAGALYLGAGVGSTGSLANQGTITVSNVQLNNGTLAMGAADTVGSLYAIAGSTATTSATGNITGGTTLNGASTLNLGADLNLGNNALAVGQGTVNAGGHAITAGNVTLGDGTNAGVLNNTGPLTVSGGLSLNSNQGAFAFKAADTTSGLYVSPNATATTVATGNVKDYAIASGGTINLGADLNLTGYAQAYNGGTIDAHSHNLTAGALYLGAGVGSTGTLANQGTITVSNVQLNNGTLAMGAADTVGSLYAIAGSTATTSATGNITGGTTLNGASTLNLGADLNLGNNALAVGQGTVNAGGHAITAGNVTLGDGTNAGVLNNTGPLTVSGGLSLNSNQGAFAFKAADTTSGLYVYQNATATTAATGNVKDYAIASGGTINLGADLNLTGYAQVYGGGTIDAHGHSLATSALYVGAGTNSLGLFSGDGGLAISNLILNDGTAALRGLGDTVSNGISLSNGSVVTLTQPNGATTGLTLDGNTASALSLNDTSVLSLVFTDTTAPSWLFRWADPTGGDWISMINADIASGQIKVNAPHGYTVTNQAGYTSINAIPGAVPEPASLALLGLGAIGLVMARRRLGRGHAEA